MKQYNYYKKDLQFFQCDNSIEYYGYATKRDTYLPKIYT